MEIIAEVGSNWVTELDSLNSVLYAKRAGADVVKFQYYTHMDLYGVSGPLCCLPNVRELSLAAREIGIEFMCTGFSPDGYDMIDPWVKRHKIASSEITDPTILRKVASFGKPVLLSTGGATMDEIERAIGFLKPNPVTVLYCVAEYPARVIDFRNLSRLKKKFGNYCDIGYSDHSTDVLNVPTMALVCDAKVIEKHVNFVGCKDTPDAPHSLSKEEFSMMVKVLRNDLPEEETFRPNPWKRQLLTLKDGTTGYFRPLNVEL